MKKFIAALVFTLIIININCSNSPKRLRHNYKNVSLFYYNEIKYDKYGLPYFYKQMKAPPSKSGSKYVLVFYRSDKILASYNIAIIKKNEKVDIINPFIPIVEFWKKGSEIGEKIPISASDPRDIFAYPFARVAMVLVAATTGAVIGTGVGTGILLADTAELIKHRVLDDGKEVILLYTEYEYDTPGRLKEITVYAPGKKGKDIGLLKSKYFYNEDEKLPYKTEVINLRENTKRSFNNN